MLEFNVARHLKRKSAVVAALLSLGGLLVVVGHVSILTFRLISAPAGMCPPGERSISLFRLKYQPDQIPTIDVSVIVGKRYLGERQILYPLVEPPVDFLLPRFEQASNAHRTEILKGNWFDEKCATFTINGEAFSQESLHKLTLGAEQTDAAAKGTALFSYIEARYLRQTINEVNKTDSQNDSMSDESGEATGTIQIKEIPLAGRPHSAAFRLYEIVPTSKFPSYGIVCMANRGLDFSDTFNSHVESTESYYIREEKLASQICYSLITQPAKIDWTILPSFYSSNWNLTGTNSLSNRIIWSVDKLASDTALLLGKTKSNGATRFAP
jgi:hypothetical protein